MRQGHLGHLHGITRCEIEDRDVFKALHYCAVDLTSGEMDEVEWRSRDVVEMAGIHLEAVVKRIGRFSFLPLGTALRKRSVNGKLDAATWRRLWSYLQIYNDAKHRFDHALGTHLFSVQDAVLAYALSRRLGQMLYPLVDLKTDWRFEHDSSDDFGFRHG